MTHVTMSKKTVKIKTQLGFPYFNLELDYAFLSKDKN